MSFLDKWWEKKSDEKKAQLIGPISIIGGFIVVALAIAAIIWMMQT